MLILGPSVNAAKRISKSTGIEIRYSGTVLGMNAMFCELSVPFPNFCGSKTFEQRSRDVHNYYLSARSKDLRKKDRLLAV